MALPVLVGANQAGARHRHPGAHRVPSRPGALEEIGIETRLGYDRPAHWVPDLGLEAGLARQRLGRLRAEAVNTVNGTASRWWDLCAWQRSSHRVRLDIDHVVALAEASPDSPAA